MDHEPQQPSGDEPGSFAARFAAHAEDTATRSRQICNDFYDFCESLGTSFDELHADYEGLSNAIGFKSAIKAEDQIFQHASTMVKGAIPDIRDYLQMTDSLQKEGRFMADLTLEEHLKNIPKFLDTTVLLRKALNGTVNIARDRSDNGPESEKAACNEWIAKATSIIQSMDYEIAALRSALTIAAGNSKSIG